MKISFFIGIGFIIVTFSLGTLIFKKLQTKYDEWREKNGLTSNKYALLNLGINKKAKLRRGAYLSSMKLRLKFMILCTLNILGLLVVIFIPFKSSTAGTRDTILATLGIISMLSIIYYLTRGIRKTYRERRQAIDEIKEEDE